MHILLPVYLYEVHDMIHTTYHTYHYYGRGKSGGGGGGGGWGGGRQGRTKSNKKKFITSVFSLSRVMYAHTHILDCTTITFPL